MDTMDTKYNCGHEGELPRNMGRGTARQNRLAAWFGRPCQVCALAHAERFARKLTQPDGTPRPASVVAGDILRRQEQVRRRY